MPFAGLQKVTANQLNGLITGVYYAIGSADLNGAATNADVPGVTVDVTTATTGATYAAFCTWAVDLTGNVTTEGLGRLSVDGSLQSPLVRWGQALTTDRLMQTQTYSGQLGSPDTYTFKIVASPPASHTIQGANSSILVLIFEAV
ncbi:hypothetical protein O7626_41115 [Micromonospora sp. WMMD1102]|uniref:hypothetical protein n=1 Tax=Micromonospora sp. WMMD1102 TaxID=3016105 RepID=UPI002414DE0F|nr:hypothetical protein [Micromonospora sp. WMMD1102]MDG4784363.1 hypothetical protein [Micromonospora sp. WMMD1102]MDG4784437.1 hypothetical protein [Micromonospora sp. WMMD1102]MDG4792206.1 hypothetical protein [Micromonospora sp. WMMD1102]